MRALFSFRKQIKGREKAYHAGLRAEVWAGLYLRLRGYKILAARYKTPVGEIDLVVVKKDVLVMVEVKSRKDLERSLEAVTPQNRRRIEKAASLFLAKHPDYADYIIRFDMMAVILQGGLWPKQLKHLDNAWAAGQ